MNKGVAWLLAAVAIVGVCLVCCCGFCIVPAALAPSDRPIRNSAPSPAAESVGVDPSPSFVASESSANDAETIVDDTGELRVDVAPTSNTEADSSVSAPLVVTIEVTPIVRADNRVQLSGTTNLPAGTELMLSVTEDSPIGFIGQSRCIIDERGQFTSETFGPTSGLPIGVYEADVTVPFAKFQPKDVQRRLGERGERMAGDLTREGTFGKTASQSIHFNVGGDSAPAEHRSRKLEIIEHSKGHLKQVEDLVRRLDAAERSLSPDTDDAEGLRRWGLFARDFNRDQQELYGASFIDEMPISQLKFHLNAACGYTLNMFTELKNGNEDGVAKWRREIEAEVEGARRELAALQKDAEILNSGSTSAGEQLSRTWTSADGQFTVEAELVGVVSDSVVLRKSGSVLEVCCSRRAI